MQLQYCLIDIQENDVNESMNLWPDPRTSTQMNFPLEVTLAFKLRDLQICIQTNWCPFKVKRFKKSIHLLITNPVFNLWQLNYFNNIHKSIDCISLHQQKGLKCLHHNKLRRKICFCVISRYIKWIKIKKNEKNDQNVWKSWLWLNSKRKTFKFVLSISLFSHFML